MIYSETHAMPHAGRADYPKAFTPSDTDSSAEEIKTYHVRAAVEK